MNDTRRADTIWMLVPGLLAVLLYLPGIGIPYFADDFQFLYESPASKIIPYLVELNPHNGFYRPIQASLLAVIQALFGWSTEPIHVVQVAMHIALCMLVFRFMRRVGASRLQALIGSSLMAVSQANVPAVLGNDTMSQVSGTLFGCLAAWLLVKNREESFSEDEEVAAGSGRIYILSVIAFALSLLSKETSPSFLAIILGIILLDAHRRRVTLISGDTIMRALPYIVVMALYMLTRAALGASQPAFGEDRYHFNIGLNIPKNIAMTLFAALLPTSSVTGFVAFKEREVMTIALIAIATLIVVGAAAYGLWLLRRRGIVAAMLACILVSMFPMAVLNHVGELYVYNTVPFVAVLLGLGLGTLLERQRERSVGQILAIVLIGLATISHAVAAWDKMRLMWRNGERATALLDEIRPFLGDVPRNGGLVLVNPPVTAPEYSVYLVYDFDMFLWGEGIFWTATGRSDFKTRVADDQMILARPAPADTLVLFMRHGRVTRHGAE